MSIPQALITGRYKVFLTGKLVACSYCKKKIYKAKWELNRRKHYCSQKCRVSDKRYICSWIRNGKVVVCECCGKRFYLSKKGLKYLHHYCSNKCKYLDQATWQLTGEEHHSWKGGRSFGQYPTKFNRKLKVFIRRRDRYTCRICGSKGNLVHHIDYNKHNCSHSNLVTLCRPCHSRTTAGDRQYWRKFFS